MAQVYCLKAFIAGKSLLFEDMKVPLKFKLVWSLANFPLGVRLLQIFEDTFDKNEIKWNHICLDCVHKGEFLWLCGFINSMGPLNCLLSCVEPSQPSSRYCQKDPHRYLQTVTFYTTINVQALKTVK